MTMKRNINPLEGFLAICLFIILGLILIHCCGCKTIKSTAKTQTAAIATTVKRDSTNNQKATAEDLERYLHIEETTIEGVPGANISLEYEANDPVDTTITSGHTTLTAYTDSKGIRHINCKTDSLVKVINRLTIDSGMKSRRYDSLLFMSRLTDTHADSTTLNEVVTKEQHGWWAALGNWLVISVVIFLFGFLTGFIAKSHITKFGL